MNMPIAERLIGARAPRKDRTEAQELTEQAYAIVLEALQLEYGADEARSEKERRQRTLRASAGADYLFGREPDSRIGKLLDLAREQEAARDWLRRNNRMRQLVLDGLRLLNTLNGNRQTTTGLVGEGLLMAYGQGSFRAPDLTVYGVSVHEALCALPLHAQQAILYRWGKMRSCH